MTTIYVTNATIVTAQEKPRKKKKQEVDSVHGECKCFTIQRNCKTMAGRNEAQNYIRAFIYTILDSHNGKMAEEEKEMWKDVLWRFSEKATEYYGKKQKFNVWNH